VPVAALNLNPRFVSVCNNASWAIGEIAMKTGAEMKTYVPGLLHYLVAIINSTELIPSLLENTAITIARLGFVCPDIVAPQLERFALQWCFYLARIRDPTEKDTAFKSLCGVVQRNPRSLLPNFGALCQAFASWQPQPPAHLREAFRVILQSYKSSLSTQWATFFGKCPASLQQYLSQMYGV